MNTNPLRALMIGAHPDDCEYKTGGIAAKLARRGHIVQFLSLTNGNTGHYEKSGVELAEIRRKEMETACRIAGVTSQVLDIPSNALESDIPTRERVIRLIRTFAPDLIFTHRTNDYHPDHRRTAMLVQDSSYAVRVPNVCPDTPCLRRAPVILYMSDDFKKPAPFSPDIVIDIDSETETKTRMLNCHVSQLYEWLPWIDGYTVPDSLDARYRHTYDALLARDGAIADTYRTRLVEVYGERGNAVRCAEAFEISEYGRALTADEYALLYRDFD